LGDDVWKVIRPSPISSPEDWPPVDDATDAASGKSKGALERGHQALVSNLARARIAFQMNSSREEVDRVRDAAWRIQHDLYHAGRLRF
jgi:hypothetical protein